MKLRVTGGTSPARRCSPFRRGRAICTVLLPLLICSTPGCDDAVMDVGVNDGVHQQQNGEDPKSKIIEAGYPSPPSPELEAELAPHADASALHPAQAGNMDEPSALQSDASDEGAAFTSDDPPSSNAVNQAIPSDRELPAPDDSPAEDFAATMGSSNTEMTEPPTTDTDAGASSSDDNETLNPSPDTCKRLSEGADTAYCSYLEECGALTFSSSCSRFGSLWSCLTESELGQQPPFTLSAPNVPGTDVCRAAAWLGRPGQVLPEPGALDCMTSDECGDPNYCVHAEACGPKTDLSGGTQLLAAELAYVRCDSPTEQPIPDGEQQCICVGFGSKGGTYAIQAPNTADALQVATAYCIDLGEEEPAGENTCEPLESQAEADYCNTSGACYKEVSLDHPLVRRATQQRSSCALLDADPKCLCEGTGSDVFRFIPDANTSGTPCDFAENLCFAGKTPAQVAGALPECGLPMSYVRSDTYCVGALECSVAAQLGDVGGTLPRNYQVGCVTVEGSSYDCEFQAWDGTQTELDIMADSIEACCGIALTVIKDALESGQL